MPQASELTLQIDLKVNDNTRLLPCPAVWVHVQSIHQWTCTQTAVFVLDFTLVAVLCTPNPPRTFPAPSHQWAVRPAVSRDLDGAGRRVSRASPAGPRQACPGRSSAQPMRHGLPRTLARRLAAQFSVCYSLLGSSGEHDGHDFRRRGPGCTPIIATLPGPVRPSPTTAAGR